LPLRLPDAEPSSADAAGKQTSSCVDRCVSFLHRTDDLPTSKKNLGEI
jgi:hypothetical protein